MGLYRFHILAARQYLRGRPASSLPAAVKTMSSKLFAVRRSNSKTSLATPQYAPDSILKLNVGGQRFDTRLRTLLADRNGPMFTLFACLLEANSEFRHPQKDEEGMFFIDEDPENFRIVLNNLRYLSQLQGCPETETVKDATEIDDDTRSTRSVGLWSRLSKKSSVNSN